MAKRITRAVITFLSLCPRGKNYLPVIFKEDGAFSVQLLTKELTEEGVICACVYAPEFEDADGHVASAEVIKKALYESARDGVRIDLRHDEKPVGSKRAYVAEQFVIQKGDPRFADMVDSKGKAVDVTGGWGTLIKIDDPELLDLYKSGAWGGVSMAGKASFEKALDDDPPPGKQNTMTPEEVQALIAKAFAENLPKALAGIEKAKADKAAEVKKAADALLPQRPLFKGDMTIENVQKHRKAVSAWELEQRLAKATTPAEIDEILKELAPPADPKTGKVSEELQKALDDKAAADARIAQLEGASGQGDGNGAGPPTHSRMEGFTKEEQDAMVVGASIAAAFNKQNGRG